jgi:hypothetical protein
MNGWVECIGPHYISILAHTTTPMEVGDVCSFEAYGETELAYFSAEFTSVARTELDATFMTALDTTSVYEVKESILEFKIVSPMSFANSDQSPRKLAHNYQAIVRSPIMMDAMIHDVSEWGIGMVGDKRFAVNTAIEIAINHNGREVYVTGEVRYSRKEAMLADLYRTGVQICSLDRLELAKWRKYIAEL